MAKNRNGVNVSPLTPVSASDGTPDVVRISGSPTVQAKAVPRQGSAKNDSPPGRGRAHRSAVKADPTNPKQQTEVGGVVDQAYRLSGLDKYVAAQELVQHIGDRTQPTIHHVAAGTAGGLVPLDHAELSNEQRELEYGPLQPKFSKNQKPLVRGIRHHCCQQLGVSRIRQYDGNEAFGHDPLSGPAVAPDVAEQRPQASGPQRKYVGADDVLAPLVNRVVARHSVVDLGVGVPGWAEDMKTGMKGWKDETGG